MKVILAQPRGFCAGVVRAIAMVECALDRFGPPIYVYHEIVHNRVVVDGLRRRGARFVNDLDEVPEGETVIFSAHGVSRLVEEAARHRRLRILDATCPLVTKVHLEGQRYAAQGRAVVLIGHADHPEIIGTRGQISSPVMLLESEDDAEHLDLPPDRPVAYVTQTTLSTDDTQRIITILKERFTDVVGPSAGDICYATQNRQRAVRELCRHVDVMLVVGASNSSNSRRLQEIASQAGLPSHLLERGEEVQAEWVCGAKVVGVTAGASAPEAMVEEVIAVLRRLAPVEVSVMPGRVEKAVFAMPAVLRSQ